MGILFRVPIFFYCWTTRIRTGNDRTKTCSVTITPSSKNMWLQRYEVFFEVPNFAAKYYLTISK